MGGIEIEAQRRLRDRRRALLALSATGPELSEVNEALQRIDVGTFGSCEACGGSIGRQRLLALPEARLCNSCVA